MLFYKRALLKNACRSGGTGRRVGFKIRYPQGCVGSIPSSGINFLLGPMGNPAKEMIFKRYLYKALRLLPPFQRNESGSFRGLVSCLVVCLALLSLLAVLTIDYLAHFPRERAQRDFSYQQRVSYGAEQAIALGQIALFSNRADFKKTSLPIVDLKISPKDLRALDSNLPKSGREFKQVSAGIDSDTLRGKARYNGISINHWSFPQKSWQLVFQEITPWNKTRGFTLVKPRFENQLENWLGYYIARKFGGGLLSPEADWVHFRLNNRFDGLRVRTESIDEDFILRRGLPKGKLFIGHINTEQVYNRGLRHLLFSDINGWEVLSPFEEDSSKDEIQELIDILQNSNAPYTTYYRLQRAIDLEALSHYMAMLELVSSIHITETHNWRLYLNPETRLLVPIAFNTAAYFWRNNIKLDAASNQLFRVMLSNPELREKKDLALWRAISGAFSTASLHQLIVDEVSRIRPDMHSTLYIGHANDKGVRFLSPADWEASIEELLDIIKDRNADISRELSFNDSAYNFRNEGKQAYLAIVVKSRAGLKLDRIELELDSPLSGIPVRLLRRGLEDIKKPLQETAELTSFSKNGIVEFEPGDVLYSNREVPSRGAPVVLPALYVYELSVPADTKIKTLRAIQSSNSITGKSYLPVADSTIDIPLKHQKDSVWWAPEKFTVKN